MSTLSPETQRGRVLAAVAEIASGSAAPVALSAVVVGAWTRHAPTFGLSGFEEAHPDAAQVRARVAALVADGYLTYVASGQLSLTPHAERWWRAHGGAAPSPRTSAPARVVAQTPRPQEAEHTISARCPVCGADATVRGQWQLALHRPAPAGTRAAPTKNRKTSCRGGGRKVSVATALDALARHVDEFRERLTSASDAFDAAQRALRSAGDDIDQALDAYEDARRELDRAATAYRSSSIWAQRKRRRLQERGA